MSGDSLGSPKNKTAHSQNATLDRGVPAMGQLDDTSTTAATEDAVAVARITPQRALHTNLRNQAGTEIGTATNPVIVSTADTAPATQNITTQDIASTTTTGANSQSIITGSPTANSAALFTLTSDQTVVVQVTGTWTGTLQTEISMDGGTTWAPRLIHQTGTFFTVAAFTANFTGGGNASGYTNFRVRAIAAMTGTAVVRVIQSDSLNTVYIGNAIKLVDGSGNVINSDNGQMLTQDTIGGSGQNRAQSVTTSAAEALGAASILVNRKFISITPTNGTVYWGFTSGVTTSSGTPIFKNQTCVLGFTDAVHVYLIAGSTVDCRIAEGA